MGCITTKAVRFMWEWFYYQGRVGATFTIDDVMSSLKEKKWHRDGMTRNTCKRLLPAIFKDWIEWVDSGTYRIRRLPPVPRNIVDRITQENERLQKWSIELEKQNSALKERLDKLKSNHEREREAYQNGRNDVILEILEAHQSVPA